eukprot:1184909-Pyramimonas_sp.AAC.1
MPVNPSYNGAADDGSSRWRAFECSTICTATCVAEVCAERERVHGQLRHVPAEHEALTAMLNEAKVSTRLPSAHGQRCCSDTS